MRFVSVCGIYAIRCIHNNRLYIGSSKCIEKRFGTHKSLLDNSKHVNKDLQKDYEEFGVGLFYWDIIEECAVEELGKLEKHYIDEFREMGYQLYNHRDVKAEDATSRERSPEVIEKMRKAQSGINNPRARLKEKDAANIKHLALSKNMNRKKIAEYYDISQAHVSAIAMNRRWKDIEPVEDEDCELNKDII